MITLLTDPINWFILLTLIALASRRKAPKPAAALFFSGLLTLWGFSSAWIAYPLLSDSEQQAAEELALPLNQIRHLHRSQNPDLAILVVSAGRVHMNAAYGEIDTVSSDSLSLLAYASWLHKRTELPVMLTQFSATANATSDTVLMNQAMLSYFNVAPRWITGMQTDHSANRPFQDASQQLLREDYHRVLLITDSRHLKLQASELARYSIEVIPAAALFSHPPAKSGFSYVLPSVEVLAWSQQQLQSKLKQPEAGAE